MKQIISKFWILVGLLILGIGANAQTNKKNIYVYMGDSVVFKAKASEVDSVALEEEKTVVSLYNRAGTKLYSAAYADVDSISYFMKTPVEPTCSTLSLLPTDWLQTYLTHNKMLLSKIPTECLTYNGATFTRLMRHVSPTHGPVMPNHTLKSIILSTTGIRKDLPTDTQWRPCSRLTTLLLSKTQKQSGSRQWKPEVQDSLLLL